MNECGICYIDLRTAYITGVIYKSSEKGCVINVRVALWVVVHKFAVYNIEQ